MSKIIFIWMMVTRVITPMGEKNDGREMYTICVENNQGVVVCYDHAYKEEILEYIKTREFKYNDFLTENK